MREKNINFEPSHALYSPLLFKNTVFQSKKFHKTKKTNNKHYFFILTVLSCIFIPSKIFAYKKDFYPDSNYNNYLNDLQITVYPHELTLNEGKEASFECRARSFNNSTYLPVKWSRVGDRLPENAIKTSAGRLTFPSLHLSNSGRYVCTAYHNGKKVEAYASLHVRSYEPQEFQSMGQSGNSVNCMADEKACTNGQCVKANYICDGEPDCSDGSDELNCPNKRQCEPNEFRCDNKRCVQKMWLCDGDDDCGDNSDERNCGIRKSGDLCQPTEFKCGDGLQCVPQSFQCDGTNDCRDGSDEIGCVQPTIVQAPDSNKVVSAGSEFKLTCRAVAVPDPYINWRLNWGPVCEPPRCQQQSEDGVGTLTVQNAQPLDQGAYTCEAINVKGRVLATPDCIVRIVNISASPPPSLKLQTCHAQGAVTSQPDSQGQCQCKPNVAGPTCEQCSTGSFNFDEKVPQTCLKCFCFGVSNQCQSSQYFRTKEKLYFSGNSQEVSLASSSGNKLVPANSQAFDLDRYGLLTYKEQNFETLYWKLPERFLGNKITSYGGQLIIQLQYQGDGPIKNEPLIILKGNGITLIHNSLNQENNFVSEKLFPIQIPTSEYSYQHLSGGAATREDLLMVLADLDNFLIRATHVDNQQSTSLGEVLWETAVPHDTQDVRALEVEQCICPPEYTGTSCEDCAPGYERSGYGPYLGTCVARRVPVGPQCSADGSVSSSVSYDGRCHCKQNTVGVTCDKCAPGSFHLSSQNPQGCLKCFCLGVTNDCHSSMLYRATIEIDYTQGAQDLLELSTYDARNPFSPSKQPQIYDQAINFNGLHESRGQTLYWKLPEKFLNNKVTSYGGSLKYTFRISNEDLMTSTEPDVIIKGNDITLHYTKRGNFYAARNNEAEIEFYENNWQRSDGQQATREHLLMTLADLSDILIKAGYNDGTTSLIKVSLEHAVTSYQSPNNELALEVEECKCPVGYVGTSCEDCAPGYSRTGGGLYLGLCQKCDCNGHASECNSEYGACINCQHNTEGDQCERCQPGFTGDATRGTPFDCQRALEEVRVRPSCQCYNHSPRGCDSLGRCLLCEHNTEGFHCETCKKGFYGDAIRGTPFDCTQCPCPGASDCFLDQSGQVQCRNCPAGFAGRLCDECAPGYSRSQTSGGRNCEPVGRVSPDRVVFVDKHQASLRVEILPSKHLSIHEGNRAKWTCKTSESFKQEEVQLKWSKIGYNELPANVHQVGNQLIIDSVQVEDAGQYRCIGTLKDVTASDEGSLIVLPQRQQTSHLPVAEQTQTVKPIVNPPQQTVDESLQAVFSCLTPGFADCEIEWHFNYIGGKLPLGVQKRGNQIFIPFVQPHHEGNYICTIYHQYGRAESNPGQLIINKASLRPMVDPPIHNVEVNDPARFRCWVPGVPKAVINWRPINSDTLPHGAQQHDSFLNFPQANLSHAGQYVCSAYDPQNDPHGTNSVESEPVKLNVRQSSDIHILPQTEQIEQTPLIPQVDPPYQTVNLKQPARFRCWVPNHPNARLRWTTHANTALPHGASEKDGYLIFSSVEEAHSGAYICTVYDPNTGQQIPSHPVQLNVNKPLSEKPLVSPPDQVVNIRDPSQIKCWIPSNKQHVQLRWNRRKSSSLPYGAYDDGRGNLIISQTDLNHEGEYECIAYDLQNKENGPQISDPATIRLNTQQPQETGSPPRPVASPPILTVQRGHVARFHCEANSATEAEIHWNFGRNNNLLRSNTIQQENDIIINSANDENVGEYICTATNAYGTGRAEPVKLVITDEPPTARVEPKMWNGKLGERHQFKCHTTGVPPPRVIWHGPNKNSGSRRLPENVVDLGDGVLEIANAKSENEGDYTCEAINSVGEASDFGTVTFSPSLSVKTDPAGPRIVFTVGEPVEIRCEAFGDPEPTIEWLHDPGPERGDLPDDFVPITITEQFIRHSKIGLKNAGRYTCKGSNQFASVTKDIYIEVVEPSQFATVNVLGGSNQYFPIGQPAQLICASSGSTLVDNLKWSRNGSNLNLPPEANDVEIPGILQFETFKPSHEGEYECNAYRKEEIIATTKVNVFSDVKLNPDVVHVEISPPQVRIVNKGDSIVLDCIVHGHSFDELTYFWSLARDGNLIRQLSKESQLVIKDADSTNDYGIYRCKVENSEGDSIGSAQVAVAVGFDAASKPQEAKFDEKTDAVLQCPVFIVPGAVVTWSKLDDELPSNAKQKNNTLLIENFDDTTSGVYVCSVQYGQNSIDGYVDAKIFVPDTTIKVSLNVSAKSVPVGERAWLDCIVIGDPNAKIEFSKEGSDELPEIAQVTGNRLLFTSVAEEHAGKYKCRATTSQGVLETNVLLNVELTKRKRKDLPNYKNKIYKYSTDLSDLKDYSSNQNLKMHKLPLNNYHILKQLNYTMLNQKNLNNKIRLQKRRQRKNQLRKRRARITAARLYKHRLLREKIAKKAALAKKNKKVDYKTVNSPNINKNFVKPTHQYSKTWQNKNNYYDIKANNEMPKTSLFGSWFASN